MKRALAMGLAIAVAGWVPVMVAGCGPTHVKVAHEKAPSPPLPPAGVYQVGGSRFLVRMGYEANMHHLCDGHYYDGEDRVGITVKDVKYIAPHWWFVDCQRYLGYKYRDRPLVSRPQR